MSHVSCVNVVIKDLDALRKVATDLGLDFVEGQTTYKWFGKWVRDYHQDDAAYKHGIDPKNYGKCDHVIRIAGDDTAYEVGVVKHPDGSYRVIWDFFGPGQRLCPFIGTKGERLLQGYAKEVAVQALAKKGYKEVSAEWCNKTNKLKVKMRATA